MTLKNMLRVMGILFVLGSATLVQANEWTPVIGEEDLNNFMRGITAERTLPNGRVSRGEYHPDGTGTLYSWGAQIPRTWEVKGDDQICITSERKTNCYQFERRCFRA
jgi:hypothetical protein